MAIDDEFGHIWTTNKDDYVLVNIDCGYAIVNREDSTALLIEDEAIEDAVIEKMLEAGNEVFDSILEALPDGQGPSVGSVFR